jgi:hypoxanthine phosphoribosyltransferase
MSIISDIGPYLPWIVPVSISALAATGYIMHRHEVVEVAQGLRNRRLFSRDGELQRGNRAPELALGRPGQNRLVGPSLVEGVSALASYVERTDPDWVVGVNLGGRLLSAYVSNKIKISPERCLFMRRSDDGTSMEFEREAGSSVRNRHEGHMLVIDDVSRTGITFATIRSFLMRTNYQREHHHFRRVSFATLIEVVEPHSAGVRMRSDWSWRTTRDPTFSFPWSNLSADVNLAVNLKRDHFQLDRKMGQVLEEYKKIGSDYGYALETAGDYIESAANYKEGRDDGDLLW